MNNRDDRGGPRQNRARARGSTTARPSGLASVEPRARQSCALPPWGILVINPGEKTVIAGSRVHRRLARTNGCGTESREHCRTRRDDENDARPVGAIVRDVLADDAVALRFDSKPREIEGWDSLANVSIVFGVEEPLGVRLGADVLICIETVGDLVRAVEDARNPNTQAHPFPRLHHVGIVMPSLERATELIELLGLAESYRGYVERYAATCIFTEGNGGSPIEFVVPSGGQLAKFNHGAGGLHHVAVEVDSLDAVTGDLATRGMSLLETSAVRGAGNFLCNFLSPGYTGGVIVELIETPVAKEERPCSDTNSCDEASTSDPLAGVH